MARVYSTRFFSAPSTSGGPFVVYTAPAGYVAVVKTFTIVWGDVAVSGLDAWIQLEDLTKFMRVTISSLPSINPDLRVIGGGQLNYGTHVLNAGDTLAVQTAAGTCDFHASGYLLTLP